jgi:hypothetical protein
VLKGEGTQAADKYQAARLVDRAAQYESGVRACLRQGLAKHVIADGNIPARWRLTTRHHSLQRSWFQWLVVFAR